MAAFVVALAVAYALSSTGEASERAHAPGAPAEPLDVASGVAGQSTLGEAEALPALVRRPKPPPPEPEEDEDVAEPAAPAPPVVDQGPVIVAPQPQPQPQPEPTPVTPQPPAEPPVEFEDSG